MSFHRLTFLLFVSSSLPLLLSFFSSFLLARLRLWQESAAGESDVESRQVCFTNNYFARQAPSVRRSPGKPENRCFSTLQAEAATSCCSSAA